MDYNSPLLSCKSQHNEEGFFRWKNVDIFRIASGTYWYTDPLAAVKHVLRLLLPMLEIALAMHDSFAVVTK